MGAGVDAAWGSADAAALIAGCRLLLNDRNLEVPLCLEPRFLAVHRNVAIGTVARALTAADAVVLDDNFFRAFPKNRINWATDQTVRIGTGSATRRDQEVFES